MNTFTMLLLQCSSTKISVKKGAKNVPKMMDRRNKNLFPYLALLFYYIWLPKLLRILNEYSSLRSLLSLLFYYTTWSELNKQDRVRLGHSISKQENFPISLSDFNTKLWSSPSVSTDFPISEFSYFVIRSLNHIFLSLTFLISLSDFYCKI